MTDGYCRSVNRLWLWWLLLPIVAIAAWIVAPFVRTAGPGAAGPTALAGQPETVLALTDDRCLPVSLAGYRGQIVVMNLWASWCPPCRDEFPELVAAQKKHRDSGLLVLAVNQRDQELSTKAVEEFVKEFGVDFDVALDTRGRTRRSFRLVGLPTMVFVDAAGIIQGVHPGPITAAEFDNGLEAILPAK